MRLHTVRLSDFRRFRQLEITDLQPGLNLFVGPNEAGKSTVAAAIRAAFLERYNTRTVADFATRGVPDARPGVEIEFEWQDEQYRLHKFFLSKARCELRVGEAQRLEGEQAQNALAAMLGFEFAAKGLSRAEHAGVPGLLWIQQGDSQSLDAVRHAGVHVRTALNQISGELASADGDRLLQRVTEKRAELLDARGKPRGVYREAEALLAQTLTELASHREARAELDAAVDSLAALRQAHAEDERDRPWQVFEQRATEARERQQAIQKEKAELEGLWRDRQQAEETLLLLQEQMRRDLQDDDELDSLRAALADNGEKLEQARAGMQAATDRHTCRQAALARARAAYDAARLAGERRDVDMLAQRQVAEVRRIDHALRQVGTLAEQLRELDRTIAGQPMREADLLALRKLSRELDELAVRRQAAATRLEYRLPRGGLTLDGEALHGSGERWVAARAEISLPDGGTVAIIPGGDDLAGLAQRESRLRAQYDELLRRLGAAGLEQAESRWLALVQAGRQADGLRRELGIHAPEGVEALRQSAAEGHLQLQRLQDRLAELSAVPVSEPGQTPQALQLELRAAEQAQAAAQEALAQCRSQVQELALLQQQFERSHRLLAQRLADPESIARREQLARRLAEARSLRADIERRVTASETAIAAHRLDLVEQDIRRFDQSAHIAREAFHARQHEIQRLQGRLEQAGAQGVGESLAQCEAQSERLTRRCAALRTRAEALTLLQQLLQSRRDAASARLQAPLRQRLEYYLGLLFPDTRLRLDESLQPTGMVRGSAEDVLSHLSYGTQEQLGILARFAYADLLREAGRPTLLILDDAMVHTDEARRDWMKRALFDAASRHQILMFTCHGSAWKDLGVAQRKLDALDRPASGGFSG